MIKAAKIAAELFVGEEVSVEDREYLMDYNHKYEEVRRKYLEHRNAGKDLIMVNFHFSATDSFMECTVDEILEELIEWDKAIAEGRIKRKRLDFGDLDWKESNPPNTGVEKKPLI